MQFITSKGKSALLGTTIFFFAIFIIVTFITLNEQTTLKITKTKETPNRTNPPPNSLLQNNSQQASFFMENFNIISINAVGQPHRWLSGEKLSRFPNGVTQLTQPNIQIKTFVTTENRSLKQEKNTIDQHWLLLAKSGTIEQDKKIKLNGDVQIQQINSKTKTLNIQTEHLDILLDQNTASTPNEVVVINENGKINATGMQINFKAHELKLLANVKGYYVFE